jgi:hypothetical protein
LAKKTTFFQKKFKMAGKSKIQKQIRRQGGKKLHNFEISLNFTTNEEKLAHDQNRPFVGQ